MSFCLKQPRDAASFRVLANSMMQDDLLPLSDVIDGDLFKEAFEFNS